ncbi:MAG: SRPBCC family protein [Chloroflexota bacterium]|nr:SRPBCC family protein [Chloroflexota bacterium]
MKIQRDITVDAGPQDVYLYLADFARHTEWSYPPHKLRLNPPAGVRVSATFESTGRDMGRDVLNKVTIREAMPNERLSYEAVMDDGQRWLNEIELVPSGSGTKITKRAVSTYLPPLKRLLYFVLGPMASAEGGKVIESDLQRIATHLTRGPRPTP